MKNQVRSKTSAARVRSDQIKSSSELQTTSNSSSFIPDRNPSTSKPDSSVTHLYYPDLQKANTTLSDITRKIMKITLNYFILQSSS